MLPSNGELEMLAKQFGCGTDLDREVIMEEVSETFDLSTFRKFISLCIFFGGTK